MIFRINRKIVKTCFIFFTVNILYCNNIYFFFYNYTLIYFEK